MLLLGARLCRQDCAVNIAQTQCAAQLEQFGVDLLCGQGAHIYDLCRMSACQTVIHSLIHPSIKPSIHPFIPLFVCYMCSPRVRYIQSWMLPVRRPPVCCCCQRHESDLTSQPQNISRHVKGKGVGLPFCAQRMVSFNINGNVHEATGSIQC